jgi:hypothetical protein
LKQFKKETGKIVVRIQEYQVNGIELKGVIWLKAILRCFLISILTNISRTDIKKQRILFKSKNDLKQKRKDD